MSVQKVFETRGITYDSIRVARQEGPPMWIAKNRPHYDRSNLR